METATGTHLRRGQVARSQLPEDLRKVDYPFTEQAIVCGCAPDSTHPEVLRLAFEL